MKKKQQQLALVGSFLRGAKRWFALAVLSTVGLALTNMLTPQIVRVTVDSVLGTEPFDLPAPILGLVERFGGAPVLRENLWMIAILIVAVAVFGFAFFYGSRVFNTKGAETLVKTMRDRVFGHLLRLPDAWYMEHQTGDIIQRCTSDIGLVKDFLSEQLVSVFRILVTLILSLSFMFSLNPKLTLIALTGIPVILVSSILFHRTVSKRFTVCDENEGKLSAIVQENLTGVRVVRAFGREIYETEKFDRQNLHYESLWDRVNRMFCMYWCTADFIANLQILLLVVFGAVFAVHGELTPGAYIAFLTYNSYLTWPIRQLGRSISEMSKAGVSLRRIGEIMRAEPEQDVPDCATADYRGDIVFDRVSYSFDGKNKVLDSVSFTVPGGKTVGILGGTGSGKSTLMRLLDRLYVLPPENGRITVGGVDIAHLPARELRSNVGFVLQEPYLFSRTVAENLRLADPAADEKKLTDAARTACLDTAIRSFPSGYDTFVGERGVTLSGGQKQRAAIARTLVPQTPILVFDDSLSAVDTETDAQIRAHLREKLGGVTTILISHRITTLMHTDRIVVMDRGRVAEEGTHAELLAKDGIYRRIYEIQNGKEGAEDDRRGSE